MTLVWVQVEAPCRWGGGNRVAASQAGLLWCGLVGWLCCFGLLGWFGWLVVLLWLAWLVGLAGMANYLAVEAA